MITKLKFTVSKELRIGSTSTSRVFNWGYANPLGQDVYFFVYGSLAKALLKIIEVWRMVAQTKWVRPAKKFKIPSLDFITSTVVLFRTNLAVKSKAANGIWIRIIQSNSGQRFIGKMSTEPQLNFLQNATKIRQSHRLPSTFRWGCCSIVW